MQAAPRDAGLDLANWKVVRQFAEERFGRVLSSRSCLNYLHRLGFVVKQPKKRLLKADAEKRAAFVATYVALRNEAQVKGAKLFFVDEAHFRADVDLRCKWVLRGTAAVVHTTSPRLGEEAAANTCFGTAAKVREKVDALFAGLAQRTTETKQRYRRVLQAQADALLSAADQLCVETSHVDFALRSV